MTNYSSQLNLWGDTGESPPSGYSYAEGEQPVDAWDNFVTFHLIDDVTNHLIPLTNSRLDSSQGSDWSERPTGSVRDGHIFYAEDNGIMEFWHHGSSQWYEFWHEGNDGTGSGLDADMVDGTHGDDLLQKMYHFQDEFIEIIGAGDTRVETFNNFDYFHPTKVTIYSDDADAEGIAYFIMEDGDTYSTSSSGSYHTYDTFPGIHDKSVDEVQVIMDNNSAGVAEIRVGLYGFYLD